ncbi:putative transposase [Thermanaeromonas toyohensis ToBE]|uniref:Putative transposase n=1 Tax=Thermanaeromonas toyohensis ToBE TaxID=698762 RepID=A0A1W1VTK1_9FIRM|nr:putative transposase [Thermanaeromonas toyohensis ToBE]
MAWSSKSHPHRLLLTKQFPLGLEMLALFQPVMLAANKIWNSCVWHSRETYKTEGRWPSETELKAKFRAFAAWKELHSQSAQATVEEYFEAVSSYRKHRNNGHGEMNPPGFKPKNCLRTVTWKRQGFAVENNTLILKLSRTREPIILPVPENWDVITLPDGTRVKGAPVEAKVKAVVRRRRVENLVLHVTFDLGVIPVRTEGLVSAYDYNSALVARTVSNGTQDLFVCRELLALMQYRNKITAEFQAKMSRCREGSRRWKKLLAAKLRALRKLDRRIKQMEHALTKHLAELDAAEGVARAVAGDLKDLRRSSRTGMKNKEASQKINQMPYHRMQAGHKYKSIMRRVHLDARTEKGTSVTCGVCGARNPAWRRKRGLWVCGSCKTTMQADLNGSTSFLKRVLLGDCIGRQLPFALKPPRVWRWDRRLNRFVQVSPRAAA